MIRRHPSANLTEKWEKSGDKHFQDTKDIYGTKLTVEVALSEISFEDYKQYVPIWPKDKWAKNIAEHFKTISDEKKESIFVISAFITVFYKYFRCFWTPWTFTGAALKKSFQHEFIQESYDKIVQAIATTPDLVDSMQIKTHYENLYGYLVVKDFLKGIDEMYWFVTSTHPIVVTRETMTGGNLMVEFGGLSVRGTHRTKIWTTYMTTGNCYSRRPSTGRYSQLVPEAQMHFENITNTKKKVEWILRGTRATINGRRRTASLIDAIHPHISNGEPCLGGWHSRLSKDSEYGYSQVFMKDLKGYLCTWSAESPFWNINQQYRRSFQFPIIKGRKNCHWNAVDTTYIRSHWPDIIRNDYAWNVARLCMQQKHETGCYTEAFLAKYEIYLNSKIVNRERTCAILNLMHGLDKTEKQFEHWRYMTEIGYARIYSLKRRGWQLNNGAGGVVSLTASVSGLRPINMFTHMIDRAMKCIQVFIDSNTENEHWMDINPTQVTDSILAEKLGALNKMEDIYTQIYETMNQKELDEYELLNEYPWESDVYYNTFVLKLFTDYKSMNKLLNSWVKRTYEREISHYTKLTKEFSNELTNHSTHAGQSELFSKGISS